jgi:hypothetical protein
LGKNLLAQSRILGMPRTIAKIPAPSATTRLRIRLYPWPILTMLAQTAVAISPIVYIVKTIQSPCRIFLAKPDMNGPRLFMGTPWA